MSERHYHIDSPDCPQCELDAFVRNHFFTGKMMGVGEFTTESLYHAEKMRHHNLRLHGWGVVCGLKVSQHPSVDCRNRYLVVDPGSALDCCGREILVTQQEYVDIGGHPGVLQAAADEFLHTLEIAVCFKDCPTEDVPVLYDECGCDDTQCAPNRILESFEFEVRLDPPLSPELGSGRAVGAIVATDLHGVTGMMSASAAGKVAIVDPQAPSSVYLLDPDHRSLVTVALPAEARALAMATTGAHFFVVTNPVAGVETEVHVYDAASGDEVNTVAPGGVRVLPGTSAASTLDMATTAAAGGALLVLDRTAGTVFRWPADALHGIKDSDDGAPLSFPGAAAQLTATEDGSVVYAIDNGPSVRGIDAASGNPQSPAGLPASARPSALATLTLGGEAMLAVASAVERRVYLLNRSTNTLTATVELAHAPGFLAATGTAADPWLTVYQQEAGHAFLQSISVAALVAGAPAFVSNPRAVGAGPRHVVLLYEFGQAGLLDLSALAAGDCSDHLWKQLEGCPSCDPPECVVLATLSNYRPSMQMLDMPARADDLAVGIARISNRRGRRMLASTLTLQAWLECLQLKGGVPGPAGAPGTPGQNGTNGLPGQNGKDGLGLNANLPKIIDIAWTHGGALDLRDFFSLHLNSRSPDKVRDRVKNGVEVPPFTIYFNKEMFGIDRQTFCLGLNSPGYYGGAGNARFTGLYNLLNHRYYGDIITTLGPLPTPNTNEAAAFAATFMPHANSFSDPLALMMLIYAFFGRLIGNDHPTDWPTLEVYLKGQFVFAGANPGHFKEEGVLDADNIGGRVGLNVNRAGPIQGGNNPSGNLTQGGTFESWLSLLFDPNKDTYMPGADGLSASFPFMPTGLAPNARPVVVAYASAEAMAAVPNVSAALARKIVEEREQQPFAGLKDFRTRLDLSDAMFKKLKNNLIIF